MQVDFGAGILPSHFLRLTSLGGKLVTHGNESNAIDFGSCVLHAVQHAGNRKFNRAHQPALFTLVDNRPERDGEAADNGQIAQTMFVRIFFDLIVIEVQRALRRLFGFGEVDVEEVLGRLLEAIGMEIRLGQIPGKLGVEHRQVHVKIDRAQKMQQFFIPMHDGAGVFAFQEPRKLCSQGIGDWKGHNGR